MQNYTSTAGKARRLIFLCLISAAIPLSCAELNTNALDPGNPEGGTLAFLNWLLLDYDAVPPQIESSSPASGKADVSATAQVSVIFTEFMASESLNKDTFLLYQDDEMVPGSVTYDSDNRTVYLSPMGGYLESGMNYTAQLTRGVRDLAGNPLEDEYAFGFQVYLDSVSPVVIAASPADGAVDVLETSALSVTFSEDMDASTVNAGTITLSQGGTPVAGSVSFAGRTATFTPDAELDYKLTYVLAVGTGAQDIGGNGLAGVYELNFVTRNVVFMFANGEYRQGDLGGRSGADAICLNRYNASYSSLGCSNVRAFLSIERGDGIYEMPTNYNTPSDVPVMGTNRVKVADSWIDLLDGSLDRPLEDAGMETSRGFWAGGEGNGHTSDFTCSGWTKTGDWWDVAFLVASDKVDNTWMGVLVGTNSCDSKHEILCVCWR